MTPAPHHTQDFVCPACEEKLGEATSYLRSWFHRKKNQYPSMHISWSYRDRDAQEQAFTEGKTRAHYPKSSHNRTNPSTMEPESYALDLFELDANGRAVFSPSFYVKIADDVKKDGDEIIWGGNFRSIGDADHFQFNPNKHT